MSDDAGEPIIEPELPIIDAHHHLWYQTDAALAAMEADDDIISRTISPTYRKYRRFLFDEFLAELNTGHNVRATCYMQGSAMLRATGPAEMRGVGEIEFANGMAAIAASHNLTDILMCAGIIGGVDLGLGDAVRPVLEAQLSAGGHRFRGVRSVAIYHDDPAILGRGRCQPHRLRDIQFRRGAAHLVDMGLSLDLFIVDQQIPELIAFASALPGLQIILDHIGFPVAVGRYAGQRAERFPVWRDAIFALAKLPNVAIKLGGLGLAAVGLPSFGARPAAGSETLAAEWRPYLESCIEAFGPTRAMFQSNFPVDAGTCGYATLWNAFKRVASGASAAEKHALFFGTAKAVYRLDVPNPTNAG
nr:amidohydrolase family protein [Sphingomonas sp. Y57]